MAVAYMGRCVMTHRIQGKINFDFTTYGSRVIGENVKWSDIAPPWGRLMWIFFCRCLKLLCTSTWSVESVALMVSERKIHEFYFYFFNMVVKGKLWHILYQHFQYVPPLGFLRTFDMLLLTYLGNKNSWKCFCCNLFEVNPLLSIIFLY